MCISLRTLVHELTPCSTLINLDVQIWPGLSCVGSQTWISAVTDHVTQVILVLSSGAVHEPLQYQHKTCGDEHYYQTASACQVCLYINRLQVLFSFRS